MVVLSPVNMETRCSGVITENFAIVTSKIYAKLTTKFKSHKQAQKEMVRIITHKSNTSQIKQLLFKKSLTTNFEKMPIDWSHTILPPPPPRHGPETFDNWCSEEDWRNNYQWPHKNDSIAVLHLRSLLRVADQVRWRFKSIREGTDGNTHKWETHRMDMDLEYIVSKVMERVKMKVSPTQPNSTTTRPKSPVKPAEPAIKTEQSVDRSFPPPPSPSAVVTNCITISDDDEEMTDQQSKVKPVRQPRHLATSPPKSPPKVVIDYITISDDDAEMKDQQSPMKPTRPSSLPLPPKKQSKPQASPSEAMDTSQLQHESSADLPPSNTDEKMDTTEPPRPKSPTPSSTSSPALFPVSSDDSTNVSSLPTPPKTTSDHVDSSQQSSSSQRLLSQGEPLNRRALSTSPEMPTTSKRKPIKRKRSIGSNDNRRSKRVKRKVGNLSLSDAYKNIKLLLDNLGEQ